VKRPRRLLRPRAGYWIGIDENGLGARLGPLIVTGVRARVSEKGALFLTRALPPKMRADLNDSKALVSTKDVALGEAWARALLKSTQGFEPETPEDLFSALCLQDDAELRRGCPKGNDKQCFFQEREVFSSSKDEVLRLLGLVERLKEKGVELELVRTLSLCTGELNRRKALGQNRFVTDLMGMERLLLGLAPEAPGQAPVLATCGKVGGMAQYGKFFQALGGRLHVVLGEGGAESAYHFPGLFELSFLRDADSIDPLVMLASLVGKYMRELLMARISRFYLVGEAKERPSGYHDPVTEIFVEQTLARRRALQIVNECFERQRDEPKLRPNQADSSQARSSQANSSQARSSERRARSVPPEHQPSLFR
jgi:ribonuclease HII